MNFLFNLAHLALNLSKEKNKGKKHTEISIVHNLWKMIFGR